MPCIAQGGGSCTVACYLGVAIKGATTVYVDAQHVAVADRAGVKARSGDIFAYEVG